ncbi:MAG: hypothetical protein L6Q65_16820 [Zoogloea sp.]|nr:hypothetical protein [Zoogloea sp.]
MEVEDARVGLAQARTQVGDLPTAKVGEPGQGPESRVRVMEDEIDRTTALEDRAAVRDTIGHLLEERLTGRLVEQGTVGN